MRWKAIAARNAGAKALIVIAREANLKEDRLSTLTYDNSAGDAGLTCNCHFATGSRSCSAAFKLNSSRSSNKQQREDCQHKPSSQPGELTLTTDVVRKEVQAYNVIGVLEGSDPSAQE